MLKKTLILTTALAFGLSIPAMAQPTAGVLGKASSQQTIVAKKAADTPTDTGSKTTKKHKKKKKPASAS